MVKKPVALLIIAFFTFLVFAPANYAAADTIDDIVTQMQEIYGYMDDYDKGNIRNARTALQSFADNPASNWDAVLGVGTADNNLLTDQVIACFGDEVQARAAIKELFISLGNVYYSSDPDALRATINDYKEKYKEDFQKLFGEDITVEEIFSLVFDARGVLPGVISNSEAGLLANDTKEDLIAAMPEYLKRAMEKALIDHPNFDGKLSTIGWTIGKLITQQEELAKFIDPQGNARLSLALAAIRSETKLAAGPTNLQVGDKPVYTIKIMGRDATSFVAWASAEPTIIEVGKDSHGYYILEAKASGTTQLIVYRDYTDANPDHDWLYKFDVTVEGSAILYGDVNGDGQITTMDLIILKRYFAEVPGIDINHDNSDIDASGAITISDMIRLQRYFAEVPGTILGPNP